MRDQLQLSLIVTNLAQAFQEAWDEFAAYAQSVMSETSYSDEGWLNEQIVSIYTQLQFVYEALALVGMLGELRKGFDAQSGELSALTFDYHGYPTSPPLDFLYRFFQPLKASVPASREVERAAALQQLERMLLGTPTIIRNANMEPENESEVRNAMYHVLIHPYPDAVRDVPIAKQSKSYKPDIGIPSLKAAIEYKFVTSEIELRRAMGGIYEDVCGYAGSEDWKVFFAVIYMTEAFFTPAQIGAEFRISKVDRSWKPLLVVGKGSRKSRGA